MTAQTRIPDATLESLFAKPHVLPTVPAAVQQLIASFERDDISIDSVAQQLAADPVLCAKTLRLANSAYFHVSRRVQTVDEALRLLGFVMVRNLVLGSSLAHAFPAMPGLDLKAFWRHSLHTAVGARWMAQVCGENSDLAFTVGLLHGLGHLVLHTAEPQRMKPLHARAPALSPGRAEVEREVLGFHHGDVGAELATRWRFPEVIADTIRALPDAEACAGAGSGAAVVHLAAWRARVEAETETAEALPVAVSRSLGVMAHWEDDDDTLVLTHGRQPHAMPPLRDLAAGLDALFA